MPRIGSAAGWFLSGALSIALLTTNLASATPDTSVLTGCLTSKGLLTKVDTGAEPMKSCSRGEDQVTWAAGEPNLVVSSATLGSSAPAATAGSEVIIGVDSVIWNPDGSSAGPCFFGGSGCFGVSIPFEVPTSTANPVAQAVLVEGTLTIPSSARMESLHEATGCDWLIGLAEESAVTRPIIWEGSQASVEAGGSGMGTITASLHTLVFLGSDPVHRIDIEFQCYSDARVTEAAYLAPLEISGLSVKVLSFGSA